MNEVDKLLNQQQAETVAALPQKSANWHNARAGRITASSISDIVTKSGKLGETGKNLLRLKAYERKIGRSAEFPKSNVYIEHGNTYEQKALDLFAEAVNIRYAEKVGLLTFGDYLGASPDGIIDSSEHGAHGCPVEVKCPQLEAHLSYCEVVDSQSLQAAKYEYWCQLQMQMLVLGKQQGYFVSYYTPMQVWDRQSASMVTQCPVGSLEPLPSHLHYALIELDESFKARLEEALKSYIIPALTK